MPRALWWSHNAYYHRWLVNSMPARVHTVLDVGCGFGGLPDLLAGKAGRVDAVDLSPKMIKLARRMHPDAANWLVGDVLDESLPLDPAGYDLVTSVSTLHHMPLRPALRRLAGLVRPGGMLAIIGLAKPVSVADYAMDAVSIPANWGVGMWLAAQHRAGKPEHGMPVRDPKQTFGQIRAAAHAETPGAVLRRRLHFRYSLLWRRMPSNG